jgi:hypothetical protein
MSPRIPLQRSASIHRMVHDSRDEHQITLHYVKNAMLPVR